MHSLLRSLEMSNFMIHRSSNFRFDRSPLTVITGANGTGKTQVLNGMLLSLGYSPRRVSTKGVGSLIGPFGDTAEVKGVFSNPRHTLVSEDRLIDRYLEEEFTVIVTIDTEGIRYAIASGERSRKVQRKDIRGIFQTVGVSGDNKLSFTEEGTVDSFSSGSPKDKLDVILRITGMGTQRERLISGLEEVDDSIKSLEPVRRRLAKEREILEELKEKVKRFKEKEGLEARKHDLEVEALWSYSDQTGSEARRIRQRMTEASERIRELEFEEGTHKKAYETFGTDERGVKKQRRELQTEMDSRKKELFSLEGRMIERRNEISRREKELGRGEKEDEDKVLAKEDNTPSERPSLSMLLELVRLDRAGSLGGRPLFSCLSFRDDISPEDRVRFESLLGTSRFMVVGGRPGVTEDPRMRMSLDGITFIPGNSEAIPTDELVNGRLSIRDIFEGDDECLAAAEKVLSGRSIEDMEGLSLVMEEGINRLVTSGIGLMGRDLVDVVSEFGGEDGLREMMLSTPPDSNKKKRTGKKETVPQDPEAIIQALKEAVEEMEGTVLEMHEQVRKDETSLIEMEERLDEVSRNRQEAEYKYRTSRDQQTQRRRDLENNTRVLETKEAEHETFKGRAERRGERPDAVRNIGEIEDELARTNERLAGIDVSEYDVRRFQEQKERVDELIQLVEQERSHIEALRTDMNRELDAWQGELRKRLTSISRNMKGLMKGIAADVRMRVTQLHHLERSGLNIEVRFLDRGFHDFSGEISAGEKVITMLALILSLHLESHSPIHSIDEFTQRLDDSRVELAFDMVRRSIDIVRSKGGSFEPQFVILCPDLLGVDLAGVTHYSLAHATQEDA